MRMIGLLGGMSWESTAEYYRLLNEGVRDRVGGLASARLVLSSVDFAEVERMQVAGDWDAAAALLAEEARRLEGAGAELLLLCTNTMHLVADDVARATTVPLLNLIDATAGAVTSAGVRAVGLLGTAFTMEKAFYRERLEAAGLEVLIPDADDRATVHRIIYDELCAGIVSDTTRREYVRIIERLADRGAEGVILGCTEIELLIDQDDSPVPVFPTTRIHVEAALAEALT